MGTKQAAERVQVARGGGDSQGKGDSSEECETAGLKRDSPCPTS